MASQCGGSMEKEREAEVCIDFTDLNKACPKDSFPLPVIDQVVDVAASNELISSLDAYSGYNQILLHPKDQEKTSFMTERGLFCYKVMPFGLKNAGATYQRLVNKMFQKQIGKSMEVYIDDMLVKSKKAEQHLEHLREALGVLRAYSMRLNPSKCTFAVSSGKFLGYLISERGIEANPSQIKAILDMPSPRNKKEIQRLNGRIAALSRFISRSSDRAQKFFKALKGKDPFGWTDQQEEAFQDLKRYLTSPPILVAPDPGDVLQMYLAVSEGAVSAVLVKEADGKQNPVFYTSKALLDAETRYSQMEKLVLALLSASRRLRPYFQSHTIEVITSFPIRAVLHKPDKAGRLLAWATKLSEFDIRFMPRTAAKSQVLADFVAEFTAGEEQAHKELQNTRAEWQIWVDGSSNTKGSGAGILMRNPHGEQIEQALRFGFQATNNDAEYEALIAGLEMSALMGATSLIVHSDSQLVVSQVQGEYAARGERTELYLERVKKLLGKFESVQMQLIPRNENSHADALANLASSVGTTTRRTVPIEFLAERSIEIGAGEVLTISAKEAGWKGEIETYLKDGTLPEDRNTAKSLRAKATRYTIHEGQLYRKSFQGILLKCLSPTEAARVLCELHEGECGSHLGGRALGRLAMLKGYYWPSMGRDAKEYSKKCTKCQMHAPVPHQPTNSLKPILSPWPFMKWGLDIVGPLPMAPSKKRFMLLMTDYFSKWVEAESYAAIKDTDVINFIWKNIICRFGLPKVIITDNGSQFISARFQNFCEENSISVRYSTPRRPQGNGQAESTNKTILKMLKKRLELKKGRWPEELPGVLWAYRTTPRESTGETPFSLVFGSEAVIPAELAEPTLRVAEANEDENEVRRRMALDELEEIREIANIRTARYKQIQAKYYNQKVRPRSFKVGDLVWRKVFQNTQEDNVGKLGPNWEGPYTISSVVKEGVYRIKDKDGDEVLRSWNATHLMPCVQ